MRRVGDAAYATALDDHHRIVRAAIEEHNGHEEGTQGDSFFVTFTSPTASVLAAIQIQLALADHEWPGGEQLRVRMGIHTGEVEQSTTGLVGYEVHRAARIAAVAHGGQVLLSASTAGLVESSLPDDVTVRDVGTHRLKDLGRPETLFQLSARGLRAEFPPLRSLDNPELPNNLPASLNPFVGRITELAEVLSLARSARMVTLTGAGGSGKTRLALQAAAELLDGSGEGVWFVELAPISDPDQVPVAVTTALGLRQDSERAVTDGLLAALRDQSVLVLLDNCEHLIDAVAKLADLIGRSCPKVSLIATSREPLGVDGEEVYRVRSLSLPGEDVEAAEDLEGSDSAALFVARARSHDKSFAVSDSNAPLVASVCRRLDGIPLAIELAAARLSSMSIKDLHDRLDQRFRLLTGGSRNALPRQQTLGAMVAWSYDLLNEPEREVLRRLTVFVDGFDLAAAEAVCATGSVDVFDVADILGSLVNKSLVAAERSGDRLRYRLLETIRQYAADQLVQLGGEAEILETRRLHAEHFLALSEEAAPELWHGPEQVAWVWRLDEEWGNLRAAFAHFAAEPDGTEKVMRISVATVAMTTLRRHAEAFDYLAAALERADDPPRELLAWSRFALARLRSLAPRLDLPVSERRRLAGEGWREALQLAREAGDRVLELICLLWAQHTVVYFEGGDASVSLTEEAVALADSLGDVWSRGMATYLQALVAGTDRERHALYSEAAACFRASQDTVALASTLVSLSLTTGWTDLASVEEARSISREALSLAMQTGAMELERLLATNLSVMDFLLGDHDEAVTLARRAVLAGRRQGTALHLSEFALFSLACIGSLRGDLQTAALLTGAMDRLDALEESSTTRFWSALEVEMRAENVERLVAGLGEAEASRLLARGGQLTDDEVVDIALGRARVSAGV